MTNGSRRGWGISVTPRPLFTPGKDPVLIVQEAGWAPGPVWIGAENLAPTEIRSPEVLLWVIRLYLRIEFIIIIIIIISSSSSSSNSSYCCGGVGVGGVGVGGGGGVGVGGVVTILFLFSF